MEKLLDVEAVADLLCIAKFSVYGLVARNQIPHVKLSRRMLRFRAPDIAEWIAQNARDIHGGQKEKKRAGKKPAYKGQDIDAIVRRAKSGVLKADK